MMELEQSATDLRQSEDLSIEGIGEYPLAVSNNVMSSSPTLLLCGQQQQQLIEDKKKRTRRKKELRRADFAEIITPSFTFNNVFHLHGDISVTSDMQIRLGGALAWGLIGIEYMKGKKITTNDQIIEVEMEYSKGVQRVSFEQVIQMISQLDSPFQKKFMEGLKLFGTHVEYKKNEALTYQMCPTKQQEQYEEFCRLSWEQIEQKRKTETLFGYSVGRCNYFTGNVEMKHMGYSKGFLNILCLNSDILQQIYLRNKPISMFIDQRDMQELSLLHMESRVNRQFHIKTRVRLTTIDGYDLWVNQTMDKHIDISNEGRVDNFYNNFTRFDIDISELEGLIKYRQSLSDSKGMGYDKLIQVELSQMLEDVEYSVESQLFMEKYYRESVVQLTELKNSLEQKKCGYRLIR